MDTTWKRDFPLRTCEICSFNSPSRPCTFLVALFMEENKKWTAPNFFLDLILIGITHIALPIKTTWSDAR